MSIEATATVERGEFYLDRDAVIIARMPTPEERKHGYAPGIPVLAVVSGSGRELVFSGDSTLVVVGAPRGTLTPDEGRDAALYALGVIGEELGNLSGLVDALANAGRVSPGAVGRLADDWRRERDLEMYCADADLCEHAARAAAAARAGRGDGLEDSNSTTARPTGSTTTPARRRPRRRRARRRQR